MCNLVLLATTTTKRNAQAQPCKRNSEALKRSELTFQPQSPLRPPRRSPPQSPPNSSKRRPSVGIRIGRDRRGLAGFNHLASGSIRFNHLAKSPDEEETSSERRYSASEDLDWYVEIQTLRVRIRQIKSERQTRANNELERVLAEAKRCRPAHQSDISGATGWPLLKWWSVR